MYFTETRLLNLGYRYKLLAVSKHNAGKANFFSTYSLKNKEWKEWRFKAGQTLTVLIVLDWV